MSEIIGTPRYNPETQRIRRDMLQYDIYVDDPCSGCDCDPCCCEEIEGDE